jgi:hypothetical protein
MNNTTRAIALGGALLVLLSVGTASAIVGGNLPEHAAPTGFFVEPEVLFLNFRDTDNAYALVSAGLASGIPQDGFVQDTGSDGEVAGRLSLGYRWSNRWHIRVTGTFMDQTDFSRITEPANGSIGALAGSVQFITDNDLDLDDDSIDIAQATMEQDFLTLDFEVGRTWGDEDAHSMTTTFGIHYLSYEQDFLAEYDSDGDLDFEYKSFRELDVDAIGIRTGIATHLALGQDTGWSFFGSFHLMALVGDFENSLRESDDVAIDPRTTTSLADLDTFLTDEFDRMIMGIDSRLGFEWARVMTDWTFAIAFGYEIMNYSDAVANSKPISARTNVMTRDYQDLGLDGPFVDFSFTW